MSSRKINAEGAEESIMSEKFMYSSQTQFFDINPGKFHLRPAETPSSPGRDSEGPAEIGRDSERPAEISNAQPRFPALDAWNAGKAQPSQTFRVFGSLGGMNWISRMNRMKRMSRKRCQQPQHRPPFLTRRGSG